MKKIPVLFLFVGLLILMSGFMLAIQESNPDYAKAVQEDFQKLDPFSGIHIAVNADVYYTPGNKHGLRIEGDERDIEDLIIEVKNESLSIRYPGYGLKRSRLTIHVVSEKLEEIKISGSSDFFASKEINSDEMDLVVSGSGKINFGSLVADELDVRISGSGDILIEEGSADECNAIISGSGKLLASGFAVDEFSTKISGSGRCEITANSELEATISGSGSVYYKGPARVHSTVSGSGKVREL